MNHWGAVLRQADRRELQELVGSGAMYVEVRLRRTLQLAFVDETFGS
jgi:hypothetical protein